MPRAARSLASAAGLAALASCASILFASCASTSDDVHLAPLVSHLSTAGGEEQWEALGGVWRTRRTAPGSDVVEWELHPLVCHDELGEGRALTRFLVPLGAQRSEPDRTQTELVPLFRLDREPDEHGKPSWHLYSFPATLFGDDSTDRKLAGVFPIYGDWERVATYDRIKFVLFPLYMRTEREGGTYHHILWPFFSFGRNGKGEFDGHVWPLFGVTKPGFSERGFMAWPIATWSKERLALPEEQQVKTWMFWPFYGEQDAGTFHAWTTLWPFFGYSSDSRSGYWAWDGPWPFVKLQRPGTSGQPKRTRFLPFYSRFEGDGLDSTWVLWPIYNQRHETYRDGERRGEMVFPFWQEYVETDNERREVGSWMKLWPLFQRHEAAGRSHLGVPTLLPLWRLPDIEEHYAWLWELYSRDTAPGRVSERSWLGLWRRESDAQETRTYVSGLWSRRKYRDGDAMIRETSLLFGLVRWRSSKAGVELLRPAFPGPGWPARGARE